MFYVCFNLFLFYHVHWNCVYVRTEEKKEKYFFEKKLLVVRVAAIFLSCTSKIFRQDFFQGHLLHHILQSVYWFLQSLMICDRKLINFQ